MDKGSCLVLGIITSIPLIIFSGIVVYWVWDIDPLYGRHEKGSFRMFCLAYVKAFSGVILTAVVYFGWKSSFAVHSALFNWEQGIGWIDNILLVLLAFAMIYPVILPLAILKNTWRQLWQKS